MVGTGIAGLYVGLRARELGLRPRLLTKSTLQESNTRYAQGGIAASLGSDDTPALHLHDTLRAGDGLVNLRAAKILADEGPARIADLVQRGVQFDTVEGRIALGREAAHSRARILHAGGDATGLRIEEALQSRVVEAGIDFRERTVLRKIRRSSRGITVTVSAPDGSDPEELEAPNLVVATGGAGNLFRESSNPRIATGEGIVLAAEAGATLADLEFVQFHPTVFHRRGAPRFLITEALRGEGALLRNARGQRFMPKYHRDAELAPRDVVSRAIVTELARTRSRQVFLDASGLPRARLYARFPTISTFLRRHGLDIAKDRIPVTPAAHFLIGGIATDTWGRSSVPGLLACGEAAATGVHGANRLASNSLLEGLVFGERVARQLRHPTPATVEVPRAIVDQPVLLGAGERYSSTIATGIRKTLWEDVGILRNAPGLRNALRRFETWLARSAPTSSDDALGPSATELLLASAIARAALVREESRGVHFRTDYPRSRPRWRTHVGIRIQRGEPGRG